MIKNGSMANFVIYFTTIFLNVKNKVLNLEDILAHVCPSLANPLEGLLF